MQSIPSLFNACHITPSGASMISCAPIYYFEEYIVSVLPDLTNPFDEVFKDGFDWIDTPLQRYVNRMERNFQERKDGNGVTYDINLPLHLPYTSREIESVLNTMCQARWIVRVAAYDNTIQVFGTLRQPLTFLYQKKAGPQIKTFSGYECQFVGSQSTAPFFLF